MKGIEKRMKKCNGVIEKKIWQIKDIIEFIEETNNNGKSLDDVAFEVCVAGAVHVIRDYKEFLFVVVRTGSGLIQTVVQQELLDSLEKPIMENSNIRVLGKLRSEQRAPNGFEIVIDEITVLSTPYDEQHISLNKYNLNLNIDTNLNNRSVTLRHVKERAIFKIQEGLLRGFRDFLHSQDFVEIRSPKIVSAGAEGGSNIFKLDYFGQKAFLAQSPQFYKQTMVGVYDRVFEAGPVFRAEKHNTTRHLNEYTSLDFEMGYIDDFSDIMNMETALLKYTFNLLREEYKTEIAILKIEIPQFDEIPTVRFDAAKEMVSKKYNRTIKDPYDLQPEEEILIGQYFKEEYGSDFVFVTHYPSKKRPFYAMDDSEDPRYTLSFDLLFGGMEITTGGQRIHDYIQQRDKIIDRGMNPDDFTSYLMIHKYGMPPHGGLGIGLERLTMKLIGESNIRAATMFPRDRTRLDP